MKPAASAILTALVCSYLFAFLPLMGLFLLALVFPTGFGFDVFWGLRAMGPAAIIGFVVGLVGWAVKHR
jgi:hypothetical protein